MTLVAMPTSANLVQFSLSLEEPAQRNLSVWTGGSKVTGLPGAGRWSASFAPHQIIEPKVKKQWRAFLLALRGPVNSFWLTVAKGQNTNSAATVGTGANAGRTLPLAGLLQSILILEAGDYITVPLPSGHHRLVMLTEDLVSSASGTAVARFRPELSEVPAAGASVEINNPYVPLALAQQKQGWTDSYGAMSIQFEAVEAR